MIDLINALFEAGGALMTWQNVRQLLRDKQVKGVYWPVTLFWALWGAWDIFYYPSLHQWFSFYAGIVLCAGNVVWVVNAIRFRPSSVVR